MTTPISKYDDVIDSRDVIARIEELKLCMGEEAQEELDTLKALQEEAENYSNDWADGATLIRDSYFTEYARELAEDCGMVIANATWPNNCIDWDEAADQLKQDYTGVDFYGVAYWVR